MSLNVSGFVVTQRERGREAEPERSGAATSGRVTGVGERRKGGKHIKTASKSCIMSLNVSFYMVSIYINVGPRILILLFLEKEEEN